MKTRIRFLRQKLKMSQKELGEEVGVTRQTINALEKGRYNPSLLLAHDITKVLNRKLFDSNQDMYFTIEEIFIIDENNGDGGQ